MARNVGVLAIRIVLTWMVPVVCIFLGFSLWIPIVLSVMLTVIELPGARKKLFRSRTRKQLPCLKVPPLMRVALLWLIQAWWVILWRASSDKDVLGSDPVVGSVVSGGEAAGAPPPAVHVNHAPPDTLAMERAPVVLGEEARRELRTISVVLPCAGEGEFAFNTVRAVYDSTPAPVLHEIIVVDDGTDPPLAETHLTHDVRERFNVRIIRHESTVGLIGTKKDGGDAASGDIVVFFDCHVAPQPGWYSSFLRLINENHRRIIAPVITDLDVGTWKQRGGNNGQAKCYLTWDADFKWFESEDEYIPILSGGLLGMSRQWWNETGGYDEVMRGWGGENLDQSLRSWLCGGEIMVAKDAFVAHMWRKPEDPRTRVKYDVPPGSPEKNRMRAAVTWFGEFGEKLEQFPSLQAKRLDSSGLPWYGDTSNIVEVKDRLKCKSFAWFMHRFKHVYEDGGLIPKETFSIRVADSDQCLTYEGPAGTSPNGRGTASLRPCDANDDRQRWHGANRDTTASGQPCCSGLRAWNTDQCLMDASSGYLSTFVCDVSGRGVRQDWEFTDNGQLRKKQGWGGMRGGKCVEYQNGVPQVAACKEPSFWIKETPSEPIESKLYRDARERGWT